MEKLYVHVFYSSNDAIAKKTALNNQLQELKSFLVDGIEDFTLITKEKIQWLFILKKSSKTGKFKVEFNEEAIDIESKCFGFFVLVSNQKMDIFEALIIKCKKL